MKYRIALFLFFTTGCATIKMIKATPNTSLDIVLKVEVYKDGVYIGNGTGFVAGKSNSSTFILTNKHICQSNADYVLVDTNLGRHSAKFYRMHNSADLCLLMVVGGTFGKVAVFTTPEIGEHITSTGAPHGAFPVSNDGILKQLVLFNNTIRDVHYYFDGYLAQLPAEEGSSGSPVFNDNHEVVGVVFATIGKLSCIVPGDLAQAFVESNMVY